MAKYKMGKDVGKEFRKTFDSRGLFTELGKMMKMRTIKKWEIRGSGRTYDEIKWKPLTASSAARKIYITSPSLGGTKKAKGSGKKRGYKHILEDTGDMLAALTYKVIGKNESRIYFLPPNSQKYYWHHFGKGDLPVRIILEVSKKDRRAIDKVVDAHVEKALQKAFGGG